MSGSISIKLDTSVLDALERNAPGAADAALSKIAFDLQADIQTHFSRKSPSAPGTPPGIVTGNLKNAIRVRKLARMAWAVYVDASIADYGAFLEWGTHKMAARPFFQPAAMRIVGRLPEVLQAVVQVVKRG